MGVNVNYHKDKETNVGGWVRVFGDLISSRGRESMTVTAIGFAVHALFAPLTA